MLYHHMETIYSKFCQNLSFHNNNPTNPLMSGNFDCTKDKLYLFCGKNGCLNKGLVVLCFLIEHSKLLLARSSLHFVLCLGFSVKYAMCKGGTEDLVMYGVQFGIHQRLVRKFEKVGAISEEKAVTRDDANLDLQEQYWLDYFAGTFLGKIKKTRDQRYYI